MKFWLVPFCLISLLFFKVTPATAQLTFNSGLTPQQMAQTLAGAGISISNATMNCAAGASASFTGTSNVGISSGIILTSGSAAVASPNTNSSSAGACNNTPGDPELDAIANASTHDACALEFDVVPLCDTIKFKYVFGSDEYPEYVGSYNDAFAFFISGPGISGQPNIATVPGSSTIVSINNVNSGSNSQYYVANSGTSIEYNPAKPTILKL